MQFYTNIDIFLVKKKEQEGGKKGGGAAAVRRLRPWEAVSLTDLQHTDGMATRPMENHLESAHELRIQIRSRCRGRIPHTPLRLVAVPRRDRLDRLAALRCTHERWNRKNAFIFYAA